jgi:hypothetical protein
MVNCMGRIVIYPQGETTGDQNMEYRKTMSSLKGWLTDLLTSISGK